MKAHIPSIADVVVGRLTSISKRNKDGCIECLDGEYDDDIFLYRGFLAGCGAGVGDRLGCHHAT
eukprot:2992264-Amphidinium_carterae.1